MRGLVICYILQVFYIQSIVTLSDAPAKLGREALEDLIQDKVIPFDDGPYFQMTIANKLEPLLESWALKNFSLITSGKSKYNEADFWVENEAFSYNEKIEAERVSGVVGLAIEMIDGLAEIKSAKSDAVQLCRVIGSSREFSPYGRAYDYYGNPAIKVLFQDTVIKKPFPHVVNDYMLDASTRPIYPVYNETVAQPFHFNFQMDPKCPLGLNRTEIEKVDRGVDKYLMPLMREFLIKDLIRQGYHFGAIKPYGQSIGVVEPDDNKAFSSFSSVGKWPDDYDNYKEWKK